MLDEGRDTLRDDPRSSAAPAPTDFRPSGPESCAADLAAWDREHVWHAFTQMQEYEPLLIESGEGCTLIDSDGRRYLDGSASMWCNVHGHGHPRLDAALLSQAGRVAHTTNLGLSNPTTIEFAKRLVEVAPPGLEKVFFTGDGSSAIEAALKMAFQYWLQADPPREGRTKFVAIGEAYHGDTLGAVAVGGVDRFTSVFAPLTFEPIRLPSPGGACPSTGRPAPTLGESLEFLERVLVEHAGNVAAMVMEPVMQAAAGIWIHPEGYLRGVRELTRKHGVLLILDEVAVGFGRTGTMFACQQENVIPDFLCLAKGLTGGYMPLAATLTHGKIYDAFLGGADRAFYYGHSYTANPLACAAALANLNLFTSESTLTHLPEKIRHFHTSLATLKSQHPWIYEIRHCGLIAGIELRRPDGGKFPIAERFGEAICLAARAHGLLTRPILDTVVLMPPLSISLAEIDHAIHALDRALSQ